MPEFILKGGDKPPAEMVEYIQENREDYLRVNIEVESSHERLRRSFHVLLKHFFNTNEWSCNGAEIYTFDKFKNYYKYHGCDGKGYSIIYNGESFFDVYKKDENGKKTKVIKRTALDCLLMKYPDARTDRLSIIPKSWTKMTKKEKSSALDLLLTEIRMCMTNDQKTLEWVAKITGDVEMLQDINYYKNIKE